MGCRGGEDSFVFKRYDELGSIPRARKVALVRESLSLPGTAGWRRLGGRAGGRGRRRDHRQGVRRPDGVPGAGDGGPTAFGGLQLLSASRTRPAQEVAAELERLFQIFNIDPADSEAWLRDTRPVAAHRHLRRHRLGWAGPFVTFYQGLLSEPPEFIEDVDVNENAITADSPSAIAVTSEGKMDTSAQIDQPSPARRAPRGRHAGPAAMNFARNAPPRRRMRSPGRRIVRTGPQLVFAPWPARP